MPWPIWSASRAHSPSQKEEPKVSSWLAAMHARSKAQGEVPSAPA